MTPERMRELATTPTVTVQPTTYTVSAIPETNINRTAFEIHVEYRGNGHWAVARHRMCLNANGGWDFEMRPSEREDEWLDAHRFDLDTALRLATEAALKVTVNGHTVADVLTWGGDAK